MYKKVETFSRNVNWENCHPWKFSGKYFNFSWVYDEKASTFKKFSWLTVTFSFIMRDRFRIQRLRHKNSMSWWLLKFDSKLTLNKTKQSLSINKAKSALLILLNQNSFNFFNYHCVAYFCNKLHSISEMKKVEVLTAFKACVLYFLSNFYFFTKW